MKLFITLIACILYQNIWAQIIVQDSLINSVAYFIKNDSIKYAINYEFNEVDKGDTLKKVYRSLDVHYKVIDSTATNYIIDWLYVPNKNAEQQTKPIRIQYQTNELGVFQKWLNPKEVIDQLYEDNYPEFIYTEKRQIQTFIKNTAKNNAVELLTPMLQNIMLRDIVSFHYFYGVSYPIHQPTWGTMTVENPITKKNIDSHFYVTIDDVFEEEALYIISSKTSTDKNAMKEMFTKDLNITKQSTSTYAFENYIKQIVHESGWPLHIESFSELIIGEESVIRYSTMEHIEEE